MKRRSVTVTELCRSDDVAQPPCTSISSFHDYDIVRTPEREDYIFGNLVRVLMTSEGEFAAPTDEVFYELEARVWRNHFGHAARPHVQFVCGAPTTFRRQERASVGLNHYSQNIYRLGVADRFTSRTNLRVDVRHCSSSEDWERVRRLAARNAGDDADWAKWRYQQYRRQVDQGFGTWLIASLSSEIVAYAGLLWEIPIFRLQDAWVREDVRRNGLARRLCTELVNHAFEVRTNAAVFVYAATGDAGDHLYASLNGRRVGRRFGHYR